LPKRGWDARLFSWLKEPLWPAKRNPQLKYSVSQDCASSYWQEGTRRNVPHMFAVCTLNVTNAGPEESGRIVKAYIKPNRIRFPSFINTDALYARGLTRSVTLNFEITPPLAHSGESFMAEIVLVDQFGVEHTVRQVVFRNFGAQAWNFQSLPEQ
jgi:hypothetical protein